MKKFIVFIVGLSVAGLGFFWFYSRHPLTATVTINGTVWHVEASVTAKEKEKGLGGRDRLLPLHGMIFVYDHKELYPFWMKGMQFPLDFIWLDGNEIIDVTQNVGVPAGDVIPVVTPKVPADKVLEVNAGEAQTYGIKIGDRVLFNK